MHDIFCNSANHKTEQMKTRARAMLGTPLDIHLIADER